MPLREYHWYAKVPEPPLAAVENAIAAGSPELLNVWLPLASVPRLTEFSTVTGIDIVVVQPAFVELTVYVVVAEGVAVTLAAVEELSPEAGDHE